LAKDAGFDQILWTDSQEHAYFEESGTMNVVFQAGNTVMTPMLSDSILDGVTRDSVLQVGRDMGYTVEERKVSVAEIVDLLRQGKLDTAFGVGTAATIAPIRSITFGSEEFVLNSQSADDFPMKAAAHLDMLKRGLSADQHNWNLRIL
jgi:branched-chain amino acid aminotransferase